MSAIDTLDAITLPKWLGRCAECRHPCNDGTSFGWRSVQVGSRLARVHSKCLARFEERTADEQYRRAE